MEIKISQAAFAKFEKEIMHEVMRRAIVAMPEVKKTLVRTSIDLANDILESPEWKDLKTPKRIAEFGFRPWEVDELDEIAYRYLIPVHHDITTLEVKTGVRTASAVLSWCNFAKLLKNPFALHDLTKRNAKTRGWEKTKTVSWLEWFEYGVTVDDWIVQYPLAPRWKFFSRSRLGLMRPAEGSSWSYPGSYLFKRTASGFKSKVTEFKKGVKADLIRSMRKA